MNTIRLLILLTLFSLQASATGYVHNMFVAHRKLQSGKECVTEKVVAKKVKPVIKAAKAPVHAKHAVIIKKAGMGGQASGIVTLNARILEEGPAALFEEETTESSEDSVVTKLVSAIRCFVFACIPKLGHS